MRAKVQGTSKAPDMDLYDGTTDPKHHLSNFKSQMYLADATDATRCKAFPTTLTNAAMKWIDSLPPRSVTSFDNLLCKFLMRFSIQKDKVKHVPCLLGVKQEVGESLRDYIERFNKACLEIQDLPTEAVIIGLVNGLREGPFSQSIPKRHPTSLSDVQERAEKYINMDKNVRLREPSWKICHTERLPPPRLIKNKKGGIHSEYSEYHKLYGYSTNDCYDQKNVIEKLARKGRLDRYFMERGVAGGGLANSSRKRHLKEVYQVRGELPDLPTISFTKEDGQDIVPRYDDPMVITMILANSHLHRTLVD
ncbi:uncharacterized protein LOC107480572 [Arachis duranensis]|uniref:Uncharacterized protein LOC107480572 n=1 Tax=Arachis duranensis TaxID=130453 RepID=A0A6P4CTP7_ARADU|nr:uncharacterized protein LOC107480572 [Arachis duranensis]